MSEAYFAYDALSNTGIKEMLRSPFHFYYLSKEGPPDPYAAHFRIGHALHKKILGVGKEIEIFTATKTMNSKAGDAFLLANKEKTCLTQDEYEMVEGMSESILSYPTILKMLEGATAEVEIYTEYEGVPCKAMLDILTPNAILDIKTTSDQASDFYWAAKSYRYDIQNAWYTFVHKLATGKDIPLYFIVCEKNGPYGIEVIELSDDVITRAHSDCMRMLELYRDCKRTRTWPRKPLEIRKIGWNSYE